MALESSRQPSTARRRSCYRQTDNRKRRFKIGVPDEHGNEVAVRVEVIAVVGDKAMVAVRDVATNRSWSAQFPLTEGETQAAARFTDAIFGKDNASRGLRDSDPFDLYDRLLKVYADAKPEQLAKLIREDAGLRQYRVLSPAEARWAGPAL